MKDKKVLVSGYADGVCAETQKWPVLPLQFEASLVRRSLSIILTLFLKQIRGQSAMHAHGMHGLRGGTGVRTVAMRLKALNASNHSLRNKTRNRRYYANDNNQHEYLRFKSHSLLYRYRHIWSFDIRDFRDVEKR